MTNDQGGYMRYSEMFLPTGREVPSDAELISHQLMIRAGLIRKLTGGIYSYLPFGYRAIRKVENIVREEMNRAGAQEVFLPMVQPAELWQESGRWVHYGKELLRFRDRHEREYCLGPTHEEVITDLVRHEIKTYRQLPRNLYQIQTKFRDEIRPRFGVMRGREFGMKDAYSFDADEAGAEISYQKMFEAYNKIFTRCGLNFRPVEADSGSIGGSYSHEFMVMADSGEDAIAFCSACAYAANVEKAEGLKPAQLSELSPSVLPIEEVHTPGVKTIDEVCAFLCVKPEEVVKTLIYTYATEGAPVSLLAVLIRGDMEVNEIKVKNRLGCDLLELASDDLILAATGSSRGFAGAIGIKARVIADYSLLGITDCVMGANREEYHLRHVLPGRDFLVPEYADLRVIRENDPCPRCGEGLRFARGIEVGHVFKLGTKYSKSMKANYLDRNGREQTIIMGCYGIGISRTVAAAIEQNHDADGIIWPLPIAPYQVIITPVNVNEQSLSETAEDIYQILLKAGIEVILDDRDERAGVKFKDADLIGIPYRITVGPKKLAEGKVEIKSRRSGTVETLPVAEVESYIMARIREGK
jgi:prolyl-tRNA synthetase